MNAKSCYLEAFLRSITSNLELQTSNLLAAPLGAWLMRSWLEDYTYKTEITWDIFAVTGVTAILIALFTITYQSLRAAWIKPVINLKNE